MSLCLVSQSSSQSANQPILFHGTHMLMIVSNITKFAQTTLLLTGQQLAMCNNIQYDVCIKSHDVLATNPIHLQMLAH